MPKLPENLVKPPVFDNPLRRTVFAEPVTAPTQEPASIETPKAQPVSFEAPIVHAETSPKTKAKPKTRPAPRTTASAEEKAGARLTVRIEDTVRCALETECFTRRVAGEKTNVAEIARTILNEWAATRSPG